MTYTFPPKGPSVRPLSLREWFVAFSLICVSWALFHVSPLLTVLSVPYFVFGLPGRIVSGSPDGWVVGTMFGTVAMVLSAIAVFVLGKTAGMIGAFQLSDPSFGIGVATFALVFGFLGAVAGGRSVWFQLNSDFRAARSGTDLPHKS